MNLKNIPLKELQDELARRGGAVAGVPHPILKSLIIGNFRELVEVCKQFMEYIDSEDYNEDHAFKQYIYECALRTVYGDDVFAYIKSRS